MMAIAMALALIGILVSDPAGNGALNPYTSCGRRTRSVAICPASDMAALHARPISKVPTRFDIHANSGRKTADQTQMSDGDHHEQDPDRCGAHAGGQRSPRLRQDHHAAGELPDHRALHLGRADFRHQPVALQVRSPPSWSRSRRRCRCAGGTSTRTVVSSSAPRPRARADRRRCRLRPRRRGEGRNQRSDRAFTSSLSCRTISVVLRMSASLRATPMVEAIARSRAFSSR